MGPAIGTQLYNSTVRKIIVQSTYKSEQMAVRCLTEKHMYARTKNSVPNKTLLCNFGNGSFLKLLQILQLKLSTIKIIDKGRNPYFGSQSILHSLFQPCEPHLLYVLVTLLRRPRKLQTAVSCQIQLIITPAEIESFTLFIEEESAAATSFARSQASFNLYPPLRVRVCVFVRACVFVRMCAGAVDVRTAQIK